MKKTPGKRPRGASKKAPKREPAASSGLEKIRRQIDEIDARIVQLLDRRAKIVRRVGEQKRRQQREFFDPSRQKRILARVGSSGSGAFPRNGLITVFKEIMSACLSLQQSLRIAVLGPAATFAHIAALKEFGSSFDYLTYDKVSDVFLAVEKEWVDYGVVPIENSTGGIVHATLDQFLDTELKIVSEIYLPINQHLLSNDPLENIHVVYSHPQAFAQCSTWLRDNLPKAKLHEVESTTRGCELARRREGGAAIASHLAAEQYRLRIVAHAIEDTKDNVTRFLVLGRSLPEESKRDKTSLMFSVKDRPGALHSLLQPFAKADINLTKIESRPTKRRAWEYFFFVDLLGHVNNAKVRKAIAQLEGECEFFKVLGSYPQDISVEEDK